MKNLGMLGKILFCLPFLGMGIMHFAKASDFATYLPGYLPGGVIWIYITGAAMLLAVISILTGRNTKLATLLLGILLIIYVLMLHLPGLSDPNLQQMAMSSTLKDLGLAGAAFMMSAQSSK